MSAIRDAFEAAARKADWDSAFENLNGLNMYEMLRSLNRLPPSTVLTIRQLAPQYASRFNTVRIEWAAKVVALEQIILPPPGDLQETGQVKDAEVFLKEKNKLTYRYYYHGTSLDDARRLMTMELAPRAVEGMTVLDWWEYTDFGKGFYTHLEENKRMARDWAKRKNRDAWGVVRFALTQAEFHGISGSPMLFPDKRNIRPPNAPVLFDGRNANWIEFVEYNRGIRTSVQRPKDNDWTGQYPWIRGPIWGRVDSGMGGGGPPIPEGIHQLNWGLAGLAALNTSAAKARRYLITKDNDHLLEAPEGSSQPAGVGGFGGSGYHGGGGTSGGGGSSDSY